MINRFKLKSPHSSLWLIPGLILWNIYEFLYLLLNNYDYIHSCDFDTLIPAVIISKIKKKYLIYDCFDFYADSLPSNIPKFFRNLVSKLEIYFSKKADLVILPELNRNRQFKNQLKHIIIINNTPSDILDYNNQKSSSDFEIFFGGVLYLNRGFKEIISATKDMHDIKLIIAGFGGETKIVSKLIEKNKNMEFLGKIPYEEVIKRTLHANLLFALYDPSVPNHKYASPNKLFEAMMCQKPIIVSDGTLMADIVKERNCGVAVNYNSIDEIRKTISHLKNHPELCKELAKNGRLAYENEYDWKIMEKRLINAYNKLK